MTNQPEQIVRRDPSLVSRQIAGETILVPIRQNAGDMESIYTLNETASRAWELIDGEHSLPDIQTAITSEFDVEPEQAWQDLLELVTQLQEIGAVTVE